MNENFNSGRSTKCWANSAITGSQAWSFGIDGSSGAASTQISTGNQNVDGTSIAYFDDDA